jgi:hypothetical protein
MANTFRWAAACACALFLVTSGASRAQTAPAETSPAAPAQRLTGSAAAAAISGNTITGKIEGEENVFFFSSDGRMSMLEGTEKTVGKWEMRGLELCLLVEGEDEECYGLEVSGNVATIREDATVAYQMQILKGNARGLQL